MTVCDCVSVVPAIIITSQPASVSDVVATQETSAGAGSEVAGNNGMASVDALASMKYTIDPQCVTQDTLTTRGTRTHADT